MSTQHTADRGTHFITITAMVVIILYGIVQAQSVLVLFIVSLFLAAIGRIPVLWMVKRRVPQIAAILLVIAAMIIILLSIGGFVALSLNNLSDAMPFYRTRAEGLLQAFKAAMAAKGIIINDEILSSYADTNALLNLFSSMFTTVSSLLSSTLLILFTVMFILLEASGFSSKIRAVNDDPAASFAKIKGFVDDIKRYMVIKMMINFAAASLIVLWLTILGVDFPLLWGCMAFLLLFIPSIGSVIAALPAILLALIQLGAGTALLTAAGYFAIGTLIGNIIEPKVMGKKFGMSTLVVFLSLIIWGNLLGIVGALLCVPLTMCLKLACEMNQGTRWIAVLLGPESPSRTASDHSRS